MMTIKQRIEVDHGGLGVTRLVLLHNTYNMKTFKTILTTIALLMGLNTFAQEKKE